MSTFTETLIEIIEDTTIYDTVTEVIRNFPATFNLTIGEKYIMNFGLFISPAGEMNDSYGRSEIEIVEGGSDIYLANSQYCAFETTWMQGSKIVTAQDIGGVGKIQLKFKILNKHTKWQIKGIPGNYSFIEFIK